MKAPIILFLTVFLFTGNLIAQPKDFYTISYLDSLNKEVRYSGVEITSLNPGILSLKRTYVKGDNITPPKTFNYNIPLEKINSFGYRSSATLGKRIITGAAIGLGSGLVLGAIAGSIKIAENYKNHSVEGALAGAVIGVMTGSIIGGITGIGAKEYEILPITNYSDEKKYQLIKNLIAKGISSNKDE